MITYEIKTVGKEVIRSEAELASDALRGKNLKKAAIHRAKQSGVNLLKRIAAPPPPVEPLQLPLKRRRKRQSSIKRSKKYTATSKDIFG